ncbi:MAG: hypothetical protein R8M14_06960 [Ghiorsea sp.]
MLPQMPTLQIVDALKVGKHVNLVSPHGRGRRQTLIDVQVLLSGLKVQKIDLKRQQYLWEAWLEQTLAMDGQVIVILHNIEYLKGQQDILNRLKKFTLLCVSELPLNDKNFQNAEIVCL